MASMCNYTTTGRGETLAPRILLVVDSIPLLQAHARLLRQFCDVATAGSAAEAVEIISRRHFDVVVTDYQMPERDGIWLLQRLRSSRPEVGRVLMSGVQSPSLGDMVAHGLVDVFYLKPVRSRELVSSLLHLAQAKMGATAALSAPRAA
jgi:CheY-like chemotaxis protein